MRWRIMMKRTLRILRSGTIVVSVGLMLLYIALLSMQAYSKRQASHILDRIEALRVGDPITKFDTAVEGCPLESNPAAIRCVLISGAYPLETLWTEFWKVLPDSWAEPMREFSNKAGLRGWRLVIFATSLDGRIGEINASIYVVGRYEALGAKWDIGPDLPAVYAQRAQTAEDKRTYLGWY